MRSLVGVFMMKQAEGKLDTLHWNYRLYRATLLVAITPTRECVCVCCHKESIVVNCCEAGTGGSLSSSASIHCVCPWKVAVAGGRPQGCAELLSSQHWTLSSLLGRSLALKRTSQLPATYSFPDYVTGQTVVKCKEQEKWGQHIMSSD